MTPPRRALPWLLASYGICIGAAGLALVIAPAWANRIEAGVTGTFAEHLAQSRGASVLGLGIVALLASRHAERSRSILPGLALASALLCGLLMMTQLSPMAVPSRWLAVLACALWTAGLAWYSTPSLPQQDKARLPRVVIISFALWTGITGLLWLMSPGPLAAMLEAQAGPGGGYFAAARGAVDLPFAWLAWSVRGRFRGASAYPVIVGLFVANIVLSLAGFIAQLESIATPSRWIVELLHLGWMLGVGAIAWKWRKTAVK